MTISKSEVPVSEQFKCQILPKERWNEAALVMANAFCDSPSYNYMFEGTIEYRKYILEWLFQRNLAVVGGKCPEAIRGVVHDDRVIACFMWTPAEHQKMSTWELVKAGLWQIPFRCGISTLNRLLETVEKFDMKKEDTSESTDESASEGGAIKLERMAVHPDFQGRGIGSECLRQVLEDAAVKVKLTTQSERNVRFYERLGFVVTSDGDYMTHSPTYSYHSWSMERLPYST